MKKVLFIIPVLLIILSGCITKERCAKFYPPQITKSDSFKKNTTEKLRDTVYIKDADSSGIKALLECDSLGNVRVKAITDYFMGKQANLPRITMKDNIITVACKCDSLKIHAILKDRETVIEHKSNTTITPPAIEVKYIPGWMWFFGITGMIAWGIGLLFGIFKLLKLTKFFI